MGNSVPNRNTVTAVARMPDQVDLFVVGHDEAIYTTSGHPWADWRRIGRHEHEKVPNTNTVTPVARMPNHLDLFVVGHDERIYTSSWHEGQDWADWRRIGRHPHEKVPKNNTVTAVARMPGHLDLFVVGHDEGIYTTWWHEGQDWVDWRRIGRHPHEKFPKNNTVTAVARMHNHLDLFVVGHDEGIYTTWWHEGQDWVDWRRIGRHPHEKVPKTNTVAAVARMPGHLDLFVVGHDEGIYTTSWHEGQDWVDWRRIGRHPHEKFPKNNTVTAVARMHDHLDLFVVGHDGGIYTTWWHEGQDWADWRRIGRHEHERVPNTNTVTAVGRRPAQTAPTVEFTDWVTVDGAANVATGTLGGVSVSASGSNVRAATAGTYTGFVEPFFSPSIPMSDTLELFVLPGYYYVLTFGSPVRNPVFHIGSLASRLEFPAGTLLFRVSGQETFEVAGSSVKGEALGGVFPTDANGTVRLTGVFESVSFSATPMPSAPNGDGIYLQVGAPAATPPPPPTAPATGLDLFVVGHNGGIYSTWWQESHPWADWFRIGYKEFLVVHFKHLVPPSAPGAPPVAPFINRQFTALERLLAQFEIRVVRGTTEDLSAAAAPGGRLAHLLNLDVGECRSSVGPLFGTTDEQDELFAERSMVGPEDLVIYIVQTLTGGDGNFAGCATHPRDRPGAVIRDLNSPGIDDWLLAHEVGHVLDLGHVDEDVPANRRFLMWPKVGWNNPPPDLTGDEEETILGSDWTRACSPDRSAWETR